ncbi:MAG: tetratricopeptide repeat protein, partial [Gammaproteobacteria bacterium]|nr:tetratricopeptide repeat protein [Gammaproteobacteria bacterium]
RDWTHLRELLPELRKRKVVDEERFEELERMVHTELLHDAAGSADPQALHQGWSDVPRRLRTSEPLVTTYAEGLIKQGYHETAANLLRDALKKSWNEQLVYLYGMIESSDPAKQLAHAEDWLKHHERDPVLLLALGRLCVRNELWGKARMYLEASIGAGARPDTYRALGELLERMNERQEAAECYRKGLLLADEAEKPRTVGRALAGRGAPDPAKLLSPG